MPDRATATLEDISVGRTRALFHAEPRRDFLAALARRLIHGRRGDVDVSRFNLHRKEKTPCNQQSKRTAMSSSTTNGCTTRNAATLW